MWVHEKLLLFSPLLCKPVVPKQLYVIGMHGFAENLCKRPARIDFSDSDCGNEPVRPVSRVQ